MNDGRLAELRQLYERGLLSKETYEAATTALSVEVGSGAGAIGHGNTVLGEGATLTVNPDPLTKNWKEQYLLALLGYCNQIDVTAIDERIIEGERVQVSDVFTSLLVERNKQPLTRTKRQHVTQALEQWLKDGREPSDKDKIAISAVEAIAALPKVVILAYPGGGKSTLVNYVASQLAHKELGKPVDFPGWPADTPPLLPVRIILRRFAANLPADPPPDKGGLVWDYLEKQLGEWGCREAFAPLKSHVAEAGALFLFDGLDEIPEAEARRTTVKEAIAQFSASLPTGRIVVTCREYAYQLGNEWRLPEKEFPIIELALFNPKQIAYFAQTWYRVLGPGKGWATEKCQLEAKGLTEAIASLPHLQELAQYPLLLTLMAQVHGRDGFLPNDRADLYERAVNLLLAHWENRIVRDEKGGKKVEAGLIVRLGIRLESLRGALERVAFVAHEEQGKQAKRDERAADIRRELLRDELERVLGDEIRFKEIADYIQYRAGLLQARDNFTYTFPHRTFQEYLTAAYLWKQPDPAGAITKRLRQDLDWWREVFLLAAGRVRTTPSNIANLIHTLFPAGLPPNLSPADNQLAILAAQALRETNFQSHVDQEQQAGEGPGRFKATLSTVQQWLVATMTVGQTIPAKERAAAGDELARLGDPRPEVMTLDGMEFCFVPAGPFYMGDNQDSDTPQHLNDSLTRPYFIGRYPVTNGQYAAFVAAEGYANPAYWPEAQRDGVWVSGRRITEWDNELRDRPADFGRPFNLPNHPVVGLTWYEALAFCRWLIATWTLLPAGWQVRLPSEAEWEKAARGGVQLPMTRPPLPAGRLASEGVHWLTDPPALQPNPFEKRLYPWEGSWDADKANGEDSQINSSNCVGLFPQGASPYGCLEMSGNVWEWTGSIYENYPYRPEDGREKMETVARSTPIALRGGSYLHGGHPLRCACRNRDHPYNRNPDFGFRLVASPS